MQKLLTKGEIILCGDFNSRTGTLPDYINTQNKSLPNNIYDDIGFDEDIHWPRNNSDKVTVAPHCQHLLDLVINNQMKILNGRTLGDSLGKFTCHKWNGSSCVDYFIASPHASCLGKSLRVLPLNSYSDHCPLLLNISAYRPFIANFNIPDLVCMPARYKWESSSPAEFKAALSAPEVESMLNGIISNNYDDSTDSNNKVTNELTNCLQKAADLSLRTTKKAKKLPHKRWFDGECFNSKRNLNRLACRLSKNTTSSHIRKSYYIERNKHTNLVKRKRLAF